ncbi:Uma2 family endonuclease [Polyangium jinanense]|uniref:Uma2 family endonuclease n=2 Tax=Polyangium jinanense TaxID=2829994 RepID=A0A9X4AX60_9BACT|nr:Uma2 family endonuclease [Polyangium jinanense]MDC3988024.1 Uma2 family endonuclease [Polyangium jinanense]
MPLVTEDEYIELERKSLDKHEFCRGVITAMAGASARHNALCANMIVSLGVALRGGPCAVLTSDQRVYVEATGLYTYPDVVVVCGAPQFHPKYRENLLNPRVIVEVLSPTTARHDQTSKFAHYRMIPSLDEYVLVYQDERRIEHYRKLPTGQWLLTECTGDEGSVELPALGCTIRLADVYEGVDRFAPEPEGQGSEPEAAQPPIKLS